VLGGHVLDALHEGDEVGAGGAGEGVGRHLDRGASGFGSRTVRWMVWSVRWLEKERT
jgi:hypothetical protein